MMTNALAISNVAMIAASDGSAPANVVPPMITGDSPGGTSSVSDLGTWTNTPTSFTYHLDDPFFCKVTAHNASGSSPAANSNTLTITSPP